MGCAAHPILVAPLSLPHCNPHLVFSVGVEVLEPIVLGCGCPVLPNCDCTYIVNTFPGGGVEVLAVLESNFLGCSCLIMFRKLTLPCCGCLGTFIPFCLPSIGVEVLEPTFLGCGCFVAAPLQLPRHSCCIPAWGRSPRAKLPGPLLPANVVPGMWLPHSTCSIVVAPLWLPRYCFSVLWPRAKLP